jgi:hypothetical protein
MLFNMIVSQVNWQQFWIRHEEVEVKGGKGSCEYMVDYDGKL